MSIRERRLPRTATLAVVIFTVALVPRLIGIGQFLTADEKNWVARGYEFVRAMKELRMNDTLQTTHPGITTLWVSGITTSVSTRLFHTLDLDGNLLRFVTASQIVMAVANAALAAGIYLAARLMLPPPLALLSALAIALNPFLIGHSKIVHVDAFLTGFLTIALFLLLAWERTGKRWLFFASAVAASLAILSKMPGVFIIPFAFLVLFSARASFGPGERGRRLRSFLGWCLLIGVITLLLWPALLWVPDPKGNVNLVRRDLTIAFLKPHHMEEAYTLNPWHYPATLLTRSAPLTLFGVALLVALPVVFPRARREARDLASSRTLWLLAVFVIGFVLMMLVVAKKGDRYVLPVFPALDILGVVGLMAATRMLITRQLEAIVPWVVGGIILAFLGPTLVRLGPYALAYHNPLVRPNLSQELGWGEGLDQVARFLDVQPDMTVASWYPVELAALTKKRVSHINAHEQFHIGAVVLYRNMFGRPPDHWANDFLDEYYKKREPIFTATVNGLPYAWVYRKPAFKANVGELRLGKTVAVELPAAVSGLSRLDLLLATYLGKATTGTFVVRVREHAVGPDLRIVRRAVRELHDSRYTTFTFDPIVGSKGVTYLVLLSAEGTREGDAPTVRVASSEKGKSYAVLPHGLVTTNTVKENAKHGLVGMRWFYTIGGKEVLHEDIARHDE